MNICDKYKTELSAFLNVKKDAISLYWKGRVALYTALKSMGISKGDEVIIPAFTCVVVPNAIIYLGATPIYVDIEEQNLCTTKNLIEKKITHKTKCIVIQNMLGLSNEVDEIVLLAKKHGLYTIEDCTHGFGGKYNGLYNGLKSDCSFYSSQWNKPFSTGVGGILLVNNQNLKRNHQIISNGSCTTNCLAPVAMILDQKLGIESGFMTTVHSYTGDQRTLDQNHKDLRRARAAATSMIPTSTGAAKALGLVLPKLSGKLDGTAIRVPTPNVSLIDLTFTSKKTTSADQINKIMVDASKIKNLKNVLSINKLALVSTDFNHNPASSIFDITQTQVINKKFCRVLSWYDNEWGFSNRMLDTMLDLKKFL